MNESRCFVRGSSGRGWGHERSGASRDARESWLSRRSAAGTGVAIMRRLADFFRARATAYALHFSANREKAGEKRLEAVQ